MPGKENKEKMKENEKREKNNRFKVNKFLPKKKS